MQIALIPARGGSKRIPRKNIRDFAGQPMISWVITAAKRSGLFDHVIVSTDDTEIADVAQQAGAEVPFMRPDTLADDFAPTRSVINHAIVESEKVFGTQVETLCNIYATAAFTQEADLIAARQRLEKVDENGFVFSAITYAHPIHRAMVETVDGKVEMLFPEHTKSRTQDLPETFHDAGMFYWGRRDAFLTQAPMFSSVSSPYFLSRDCAVDIDTQEDWDLAVSLFEFLRYPTR